MLAGGGVKRGMIYGKSDALGGEPEEDRVGVEDLAQTVYNQLGITGDKELMAPGNRPIEIVDGGRVLDEIRKEQARRAEEARPLQLFLKRLLTI